MITRIKANILFYNMDVVGKDKEIYKFHLHDLEIENEIPEQENQIYYDYFLVNSCVKQILQDMKNSEFLKNHFKEDSSIEVITDNNNHFSILLSYLYTFI